MRKKCVFLLVLICIMFLPIKTYALSINNYFYILEDCSGLLGDPSIDTTVAWLINKILDILKIVGPMIAIVISSFDFAMVIISGDDEGMARAKKKLFSRLVLVAALFFIPVLTKVILSVLGITGNAACGII